MKNRATLAFLVLAITTLTSVVLVLRAQMQKEPTPTMQIADSLELPLTNYKKKSETISSDVDFDSPRARKSRRYDKANIVTTPLPGEGEVIIGSHVPKFTTLPVAQSDVVIVADVTDSQAFLSNDSTGIYSEFTLAVTRLFKDSTSLLQSKDLVTAERIGGRVKFPSGQVVKYTVDGQGFPRKGRKYVFFLERDEERKTYSILTAFELRNGRVFSIDAGNSVEVSDASEDQFLMTVQGIVGKNEPKLNDKGVVGP